MDKSYIIRIYQQEAAAEAISGVVEDIEQNKRTCFHNANELWKLVTNSAHKNTNNIINMASNNTLNKHSA